MKKVDEITLKLLESLEAEVKSLVQERNELREWKESDMKIWMPVINFFQENGFKLGMKPGQSISEFIVTYFKSKL